MGRSSNGLIGELTGLIFIGACALAMQPAGAAIVPVDFSGYSAASPVDVAVSGSLLTVTWYDSGTACKVRLNLDPALPILNEIRYGPSLLAQNVTIRYYVTEGSRSAGSPGENYIFFDNPSARPYTQNTSTLNLTLARVSSSGNRVAITLSPFSAGSFTGNLVLNFYDQSPLFLLEAAMAQPNDLKAYYYGATLASSSFSTFAWMNTSGTIVRETPTGTSYKNKAVRHRTIMAESAAGTLSVFPPPHSFFFPRNNTQNLSLTKIGLNKFGVRQAATGGGAYSPWFDAPAGRTQRMPMFVHLSGGNAATALNQVKAYTHNDTFKPMSGRITFSSHFHPDLTYPWMQGDHTPITNFKAVLKGMGVNVVQSAEFHGELLDKYGASRLSHLDAYFASSRQYSDSQFLIIPSEEGNGSKDHLVSHWMQLFPKPVYFTWTRNAGQPFSETLATYGTVYHLGSQTDLLNLFAGEQAVAWTAHPRIKGSYASPDDYKTQSWYRSETWLGGAWKAMPGDLSQPLGMRVFKLLHDMNNWGQVKYTHGEVDFFCDGHPASPPGERMDSTHEVYGHMNINYLSVPNVPLFNNGWTSVVNALKTGNYFTTTGEILIYSWSLTASTLTADVEWTFPLARAEIVTSNGTVATRTTVGLPSTREFGRQTFSWSIPAGTSWARLEVSDVARNVAYTQPKRIP